MFTSRRRSRPSSVARQAFRLLSITSGSARELSSAEPDSDPITACIDTRRTSCIPIVGRFDAAIPVQKRAFLKLIVSALTLSTGATFPSMRVAGSSRNVLVALDHLQSWRPSFETKPPAGVRSTGRLHHARPGLGDFRCKKATAMEGFRN